MAEPRDDLLKLAHTFLSSPKVQAAAKDKKVAFLKSKGLTDDEIKIAFERVDVGALSNNSTSGSTSASTSTTTTTENSASTPAPAATAASSPPSEPVSAPVKTRYTPPPAALIPQPAPEPVILYQRAPQAPKVPTQQVLAIAIIFGVGLTGIASGVIGIVKRLLYPVFATYAGYRHSRYAHQRALLEKVVSAVDKEIKEDKDEQDELDTLDKPGVFALVSEQEQMADRIAQLVAKTKDYTAASTRSSAATGLHDIHTSITSWSDAVRDELRKPHAGASAKSLMTELRSLKGICLNRRF